MLIINLIAVAVFVGLGIRSKRLRLPLLVGFTCSVAPSSMASPTPSPTPPCKANVHVDLGATIVRGLPSPGFGVTLASTPVTLQGTVLKDEAAHVSCSKVDHAVSDVTWSVVSKPTGSTAGLSHTNTRAPVLLLDKLGEYTVRMTACSGTCSVASLSIADGRVEPFKVAAASRDVKIVAVDPRELLVDAFRTLKDRLVKFYALDPSATLTVSALPLLNQPVVTYASVSATAGRRITFEVQRSAGTVWIGVPHPNQNASIWFEMERKGNDFVPRSQNSASSTPFPAWGKEAIINSSWKWTNDGSWQTYTIVSSIPHWTPVVAADSPSLRLDHDVHDAVWATGARGMALINANQVNDHTDLGHRAIQPWSSLTLRGTVTRSGIADGDFALQHTVAYMEDFPPSLVDEVDRGSLLQGSESDPSWPGMDLDVDVAMDHDTFFLSTEEPALNTPPNTGNLGIEIEHFAVPPAYRPRRGDWIQATGRLILDAGHDMKAGGHYHFWSEIHPPELLVSSRNRGEIGVEASVIATGAWLGMPISFVVNPPPRPFPTAKLVVSTHRANGSKGFDKDENVKFTLRGVPSNDQPNHLIGTIEGTGGNHPGLNSTGMVFETRTRGLQVVIDAHWETVPTFVKAQVLDAGSTPANGTHLFYRPDVAGANWRDTVVDAQGRVQIDGLAPERYYFRPAGSEYAFAGVPKLVALKPGANDLTFHAANKTGPKNVLGVPVGNSDPLASAALASYTQMLLSIDQQTGAGHLGVANNGFGERTVVPVAVHLASAVDGKGQPIKDLASAYKKPLQGPNGSQSFPSYPGSSFLTGSQGPGVAGATLHVRLLLGNDAVGYRVAADLPNMTTDAQGYAALLLDAGSHVEDATVSVEVTANPANPWLVTSTRGDTLLLYPARTGDDAVAQTPYRLTVQPSQHVPRAEDAGSKAIFAARLRQGLAAGKQPSPEQTSQKAVFVPLAPEARSQLHLDEFVPLPLAP